MIIKNAKVYIEDGRFVPLDIIIEGEYFIDLIDYQSRYANTGDELLDAAGLMAVPGLIDIHFHGCINHDLSDGTLEAITAIAEYELDNGITTICPATMTVSEDNLLQIAKVGPFISKEKKGAQNERYILPPNLTLYHLLQRISNNKIKLIDIAPETPQAMEFIKAVKDEVVVSIAHTAANYDTAMEAINAGASHVTHLYNAMPPYLHRSPGVIGAASDSPNCMVELICDGVHIHPAVVRNTFRIFGEDRVVLVSDSLRATGLGDGVSSLGGQRVFVNDKIATLEDGTIAGSVSNLMDCVRVCVNTMNIPLKQAIKSSAVNSAKAIGIYDKYGSITPGKYADVILMDNDLNLKGVIKKGRLIKGQDLLMK